MTLKIIIYLLLFISLKTFTHGKTYKRNELIKELIEQHDLTEEQAGKVSCVADFSGFETDRINNHEERLESELKDKNLLLKYASFKPNYGIFRISSEFWCSETGVGGICNVNCKDFLDDDITDDIECFKKIAPDFIVSQRLDRLVNEYFSTEENGLTNTNYYDEFKKPWYFLFGDSYSCPWFKHIVNYFTNSEEKVSDWNSLDDCWTNYPDFQYKYIIPIGGKEPDVPLYRGERVRFHHEFPHAAAIGWSDLINHTINWKCGGSLISEDTILTAAHCLKFKDIGLPDVVRLGDLNLETDTDEKEAQQLEVLSVHIHPEYKIKFNDIALIKLKTKVEVTKFVLSACLWDRHDLPREVDLEVCGFGQTKHRGGYSPTLMKASLSAISMDDCDDHYYGADRYLKEGLLESAHLCAGDKSGVGMDTCKGDSGGPLQMKLHYGDRLVPFIVGVTSFGENCGAGTPGVYARVSSYVDWIKEHVPDLEVNGVECSKKHEELRYTDWIQYRLEFEPEKLVFGDQLGQNTSATIISDHFLITAASNLKKISNPKRVHFTINSTDILIDKIFYHPKYVDGYPENDLALIKLKSRISWKYKDHPACISQKIWTPMKVIFTKEKLSSWNDILGERIMTSELNNCVARNDSKADLNNETFTCFKTESSYHVPDYCTVPVGSVIPYFPYTEKHKTVIKGLAIQSQDCTFTLATNISMHYEWINSVVFGSKTD